MIREKRSVSLSGHRTSVALEPEFWAVIDSYLAGDAVSLAAFIAAQDERRIAVKFYGGLAAWLRLWALNHVKGKGSAAPRA